jgi:hypothetical protein
MIHVSTPVLGRASYKAQWVPGAVILQAEGQKPSPGHKVWLHMGPEEVFPPIHELLWLPPEGNWIQQLTSFEVNTSFPARTPPRSVNVRDADGMHVVPVEVVPERLAMLFTNGGEAALPPRWQRARVDGVFVGSHAGAYFMVAWGSVPSPCYEVRIRQYQGIPPGQFEIVQRLVPGKVCADVVSEFLVSERISVSGDPRSVTVLSAGKTWTVDVVEIPITELPDGEIPVPFLVEEGGEIPVPYRAAGTLHVVSEKQLQDLGSPLEAVKTSGARLALRLPTREGVGYSTAFDFREAFLDAIKDLPPTDPTCCDLLETVVVSGRRGVRRIDRTLAHVRARRRVDGSESGPAADRHRYRCAGAVPSTVNFVCSTSSVSVRRQVDPLRTHVSLWMTLASTSCGLPSMRTWTRWSFCSTRTIARSLRSVTSWIV